MTLAEQHPSTQQALPLAIGLTAAIVAAREDEPLILTLRPGADAPTALPSGEFDPLRHRTFEIGLRAFVAEQTGAPIGYVEQLYTFGIADATPAPATAIRTSSRSAISR